MSAVSFHSIVDGSDNIDSLEITMLKKEIAELRRSRDEWRKDAKELAQVLSSKGISVRFTQS